MGETVEIWECPECGEKLDISEVGFYKEVACPNCPHKEIVHTQLANFKLTGVLGIGGMSVVFKANDLILNRPLAIKVLNDTYKDQPERIARFENECAMMARVRHDNVVSVYSAGWARGQFYIAMELVRGHDMEHIIRHGRPQTPAAALEVTREVALGLQAAAQAGLLHRDMKPGNILISQMNGRAKVLDFGLSLGAQAEDKEEVIWATPFYVAPETLMREQEDVRTDIYALGMTMRYLLTGEDTLQGNFSSITDLLEAKKKLPSFADKLPGATPALIDLVDHMTAFNPADRPPSYPDLIMELDEVIAIQSREDSVKAPQKLAKRRRFLQNCNTAAILLGIASAAGIVTPLALPEPKQESVLLEKISDLGDISVFDKGVEAVSKGDWTVAKYSFEKVSTKANDHVLAATSALLRYYLAVTEMDKEGANRFMNEFHEHITQCKNCSSAAYFFCIQLFKADRILSDPHLEGDVDKVQRPVVAAIVCVARAARLADQGQGAMKEHLDRARSMFQESNPLFFKLAERLDHFQKQGASNFDLLHSALIAQKFSQFDSLIAKMAKESNSKLMHNRITALQEIRSIGEISLQLLAKRVPEDVHAAMSPDEMRAAAEKLNEQGLGQEMYCMGLLMHGNYGAAFEADPYRNDTHSAKPFAVMMRHWKGLLFSGFGENFSLNFRKDTVRETLQAMQEALDMGASANTTDSNGDGPLHWAQHAWPHTMDAKMICDFLLEKGRADINLRNKAGHTPLDKAREAYGERGSSYLYLVEKGATGTPDPADSKGSDVAVCRLIYGISKADIGICRKALDNGANPNNRWLYDTEEKKARLCAPELKEIVQLLLDKGMDPKILKNAQAKYGRKMGSNAAQTSKDQNLSLHFRKNTVQETLQAMQEALNRGVSVNATDSAGDGPLHWAIRAWENPDEAKDIIAFLCENGKADINLRNNAGKAPLDLALERFGEKNYAVFYLVENGATGVFDPGESSNPAIAECRLLYGISQRDIAMCRKAIANGANVRSTWIYNTSEKLQRLGSPGWTEIVRLLLDNGMNPNGRKGFAILHQAREPKTVELLLERGGDPNLPTSSGFSPLFHIFTSDVAEVLVKHGADVNRRSREGYTPLHITWFPEVVHFLLDHGADMRAKSNNGSTCMHSYRSSPGRTIEILKIFISRGMDVNVQDNNGNAPAHSLAVRPSSPKSVEDLLVFLKQNGADLNIKNNEGETPLDICINRFGENSDCVKHLRQMGARTAK